MKYNLICFDMDGVIYSSEEIIGKAYQNAIHEFSKRSGVQIHIPEVDNIMEEIGKPVKEIFQNLFPHLTEEQRDGISALTLEFLLELIKSKKGELLPGVEKVFEQLSKMDVKIGLASNGREKYLDAILKTYGLSSYFHSFAYINQGEIRTKGDIIKSYMNEFDEDPGNVLMVGDRMSDYNAARDAGVDFACVLSGHGNDFTDEELTYTIHNLEEILDVLV